MNNVVKIADGSRYAGRPDDAKRWGATHGALSGGERQLCLVNRNDQRVSAQYKRLDSIVKRMTALMIAQPGCPWLGVWHADLGVYVAQAWQKRPSNGNARITLQVGLRIWHESTLKK